MARWLLIGGGAVLVVLVLLWREMRPIEANTANARRLTPRVDLPPVPPARPADPIVATAAPDPIPAEPTQPTKLDPRSDEFFYKFDEAIPKILTRNAARCYEGRHGQLHRNQKLSLRYKMKIVHGEVQVHDVTVKESTLGDSALETCFIQAVQRSTWQDDQLPDWEQDDELVLRPERGMKKFWSENVDYVGAEAPRGDQ
jgi:hypothetical protein